MRQKIMDEILKNRESVKLDEMRIDLEKNKDLRKFFRNGLIWVWAAVPLFAIPGPWYLFFIALAWSTSQVFISILENIDTKIKSEATFIALIEMLMKEGAEEEGFPGGG